jgi:hypothetical protein
MSEKQQMLRERFSEAMRGLMCSLLDGLAPQEIVMKALPKEE